MQWLPGGFQIQFKVLVSTYKVLHGIGHQVICRTTFIVSLSLTVSAHPTKNNRQTMFQVPPSSSAVLLGLGVVPSLWLWKTTLGDRVSSCIVSLHKVSEDQAILLGIKTRQLGHLYW